MYGILLSPGHRWYHASVTLHKIITTIYQSISNDKRIYLIVSFTCRLVRGRRAMRCPFKSNSRIWRLSWGMAITPVGDTDIRLTAESVRIVVNADRIFRSSHTLTVRSSEPDTTLSSRVKTVDVTLLKTTSKQYKLFIVKNIHQSWLMSLLGVALEHGHDRNLIAEIPQSKCWVSGRGHHQPLRWMCRDVRQLMIMAR